MERSFTAKNGKFYKDGQVHRILSGEIHYFRIMRPQWSDRLEKLREFGCTSVSTSVPWIIHEPSEGNFNFSDNLDLAEFIKLAQNNDLSVILRIGPYTGCDIDRGGLPGWLFKSEARVHRSSDPRFMKKVGAYFNALSKHVSPFLYRNGGPIILIQLEQEYRSYGLDYKYLPALVDCAEAAFPGTQFFTSDMPDSISAMRGDTRLFTALNFGSNAKDSFAKARAEEPENPQFCMEFWTGWQDSWTGAHHVRTADSMAKALEEMLTMNASVNFYMFAGGTNFGYLAGALQGERFEPGTTSYDYDALVSESGQCTDKYFLLNSVLKKHESRTVVATRHPLDFFEKKNIIFPNKAGFFSTVTRISHPVRNSYPLSMEAAGLYKGFMLYRTVLKGPLEDAVLSINGLQDRAQIFINEKYSETLFCNDNHTACIIDFDEQTAQLDILVENMGGLSNSLCSVCYKGITREVLINGKILFDWEMFLLPLDTTVGIPFSSTSSAENESQPAFYQAMFAVEKPKDSFLCLRGWKKGLCFINGFNLGRYWNEGPQQNLFVPAPLFRKGKNEIILFELYRPSDTSIEFVSESHYGRKSPIKKSISSRMQQFMR